MVPIARLASGLFACTGTTVEHFTRNPTFFLITFNSTTLFKNTFLGFDLAGRPFVGDFEQLNPCNMKKNMVPNNMFHEVLGITVIGSQLCLISLFSG